jgi:hypothetical protein
MKRGKESEDTLKKFHELQTVHNQENKGSEYLNPGSQRGDTPDHR